MKEQKYYLEDAECGLSVYDAVALDGEDEEIIISLKFGPDDKYFKKFTYRSFGKCTYEWKNANDSGKMDDIPFDLIMTLSEILPMIQDITGNRVFAETRIYKGKPIARLYED